MDPAASTCIKCKSRPATIDIKFALYCEECFLDACYHKYRSGVGKINASEQRSQRDESVLLCFPYEHGKRQFYYQDNADDGSTLSSEAAASLLLLHFSQLPEVLEPARKNLSLYHLALPVLTAEDFRAAQSFAQRICAVYDGFSLGTVYLLCFGKLVTSETALIPANVEANVDFSSMMEGSQDGLSQFNLSPSHLIDSLNYSLLHHQVHLLKKLHVLHRAFIPDTSTALASLIVAATCKGRGEFLPWDSALTRKFPGDLSFSRPLKEISDREAAIYCNLSQGQFLFPRMERESADVVSRGFKTIDDLAAAFVSNLDKEQPGTANVVIRTSGKINTLVEEAREHCLICFGPMTQFTCCYACRPLEKLFRCSK